MEIAHGHSIGVSGHYYRPKPSEILQDYITHAADALTVSNEHRLRKQIEAAELKHSVEWDALKTEMNELRKLIGGLGSHYNNLTPDDRVGYQRTILRNMQDRVSDQLQEEEGLIR